jgi:hypothetical protein
MVTLFCEKSADFLVGPRFAFSTSDMAQPHLYSERPSSMTIRTAALAVGLFAAGCVISPKPEPPEAEPSLDLGATVVDTQVIGNLDLRGEPGAAGPPGATVRAYPLGSDAPMQETTVAADGSFLLEGLAFDGEEVRVQVLTSTSRTEPVDLVMDLTWGPPVPATRPLADCLELTPALELDLAEQQAVQVMSTCAEDVTLAAPAPRRALPELELGADQTWPVTLAPGEQLTITVVLTAAPGFDEEIFFIEATAPTADRRPITVRPP